MNRKRQVARVVVGFLQVSDSLARDLERLGLERRTKDVDVAAWLAGLHSQSSGQSSERPEYDY